MHCPKCFHRKVRSHNPPDWGKVGEAWQRLTKQELTIDFERLFSDFVSLFKSSPVSFIELVKKSHHLPEGLPDNFNELDISGKARHLFAQFRFLFQFSELKEFVNGADMFPDTFKSHFGPETTIIFESICWLYQTMLYSLEGTRLFEEVASDLVVCFSKLLIPNGSHHLISTSFHLDNVYISPVFIDLESVKHKAGFYMVQEDGAIALVDTKSVLIQRIEPMTLTGLVSNDQLIFSDASETVLTIQFPSNESASDALMFSVTPPPRGFMHLAAFLHSISAFETFDKFFPPELAKLPEEFNQSVRACMTADTMELLLYAYTAPLQESKIIINNIGFFAEYMGESILPFVRAMVHYYCRENWSAITMWKPNSQMTSFFSRVLKLCGSDYITLVMNEFMRLIDENVTKINGSPTYDGLITDDHDSEAFIDHIFKPFIDFLFKSIDQMPAICRVLHRIVFVRTSGFYVNRDDAFLVLPNMLFLRSLLPPITEQTWIRYNQDLKKNRLAALLSSSVFAMFYGLGWPENKEPYMVKYNDYMKGMFKTALEFTSKVIDCSSMTFDKDKIKECGRPYPTIEILKGVARRVIHMDLEWTNEIIRPHPYQVSIMQMIEEYVYDFKDFLDVQEY